MQELEIVAKIVENLTSDATSALRMYFGYKLLSMAMICGFWGSVATAIYRLIIKAYNMNAPAIEESETEEEGV